MFYILSCNSTVGTCCSDAGLVSVINIISSIIEIIQVIVPVILIVSASIQLTTMMMNPDDPKEVKKRTLYNKFIAAVIVFLVPIIVNVVMGLIGNTGAGTWTACWDSAKAEIPNINDYNYKTNISNPKIKHIKLMEISDTIIKSNLLITDFSSVIFDFVYQRKPIIIYIPDSEDPNIKDKYDDDYYNLINNMKNGTIQFENKYNTTEQVINKIIYYIDNNFELESNVKEFYNSIQMW